MKIKKAYIVHIDFDGDIIESKYCWGEWLVFTKLEEVEDVVIEALTDLMRHQKERGRDTTRINKVITSKRLLKKYIDRGGDAYGNWEISIYQSEG